MTFYQRWHNAIVGVYDWFIRSYGYLPTEEEYAQKHFGHLGPLPSVNDLILNVSMVFVNTHRAIFPPRPTMPSTELINCMHHFQIYSEMFILWIGIVSIGGAHLKAPKPLPKDLQTFIDGAKHGVIYFSLGTIVRASKLPKEKLAAFIGMFELLPWFQSFANSENCHECSPKLCRYIQSS